MIKIRRKELLAGIVLLTAFMYWWHANRFEMIRDHRMFPVYTAVGLIGVPVTALVFRAEHNGRAFRRLLLSCVSLFGVFSTLLGTMRYQVSAEEASQYLALAERYRHVRIEDERFRIFSTDNLLSMGGYQRVTGSFLSTKNSSILAFYKGFMDIDEANALLHKCGYEDLFEGNPYDWVFICSAKNDEPLEFFRSCVNELLEG